MSYSKSSLYGQYLTISPISKMAVQSSLSSTPSLSTLVSNTLFNPLISGPLLLYVLLNPTVLDKLPWPGVKYYKVPGDLPWPFPSSIRFGATPPLQLLKFLVTWGLILKVNQFFSRLALNYGHLKRQGVPWDFQTEGKETIMITGGCSGFGKEMAKLFGANTKARIVVLDVQPLPDDLKGGKSSALSSTLSWSESSIHKLCTELTRDSSPSLLPQSRFDIDSINP